MGRLWTFRDTLGCVNPEFWFCYEHSIFPDHEFEMHFHDFTELVLVRHGCGLHVLRNEAYPITSGDVFVVAPNEEHGYRDIEGLDLCNFMIDMDRFLDRNSDLHRLIGFHALFHLEPEYRTKRGLPSRFHLNKQQMLYLYDLLEPIEEEYRGQKPGFESMIRAYLTLVVGYLSREYVEQESPPSRELLALSRVRTFIETNYPSAISLDDLADTACMSKNTLLRAFSHCYGTSPIQYLMQHRLLKAREMLQDVNASVTDVAYAVGFNDSSYFSRQFRLLFGTSPREFKRRAV